MGIGAEGLPGVRFPPPLVYVGGFVAGWGLEQAWPIGSLPRALAIAAGVLGVLIWMWFDTRAMVHFARARTSIPPSKPTTSLITDGPYRVTRNPMYLGMAFLYAGLALAFGVIWALVTLPVVLLVVDRVVIPPEERYLEAQFGAAYREYRGRVRRWV